MIRPYAAMTTSIIAPFGWFLQWFGMMTYSGSSSFAFRYAVVTSMVVCIAHPYAPARLQSAFSVSFATTGDSGWEGLSSYSFPPTTALARSCIPRGFFLTWYVQRSLMGFFGGVPSYTLNTLFFVHLSTSRSLAACHFDLSISLLSTAFHVSSRSGKSSRSAPSTKASFSRLCSSSRYTSSASFSSAFLTAEMVILLVPFHFLPSSFSDMVSHHSVPWSRASVFSLTFESVSAFSVTCYLRSGRKVTKCNLSGLHRSFSGPCEQFIRGRAFALSRDVVTVPAVLTQEPRLVCLRQLCALQHRSHPVLDDPILHFDTAVGLVMFSWNYTQLDSFVSCPCCHVFAFKTLVTYRVMGAPLRGCFH